MRVKGLYDGLNLRSCERGPQHSIPAVAGGHATLVRRPVRRKRRRDVGATTTCFGGFSGGSFHPSTAERLWRIQEASVLNDCGFENHPGFRTQQRFRNRIQCVAACDECFLCLAIGIVQQSTNLGHRFGGRFTVIACPNIAAGHNPCSPHLDHSIFSPCPIRRPSSGHRGRHFNVAGAPLVHLNNFFSHWPFILTGLAKVRFAIGIFVFFRQPHG